VTTYSSSHVSEIRAKRQSNERPGREFESFYWPKLYNIVAITMDKTRKKEKM
jgi:hypothetical protein